MCILSIVVPIYNVEKYLDDCIKSILTQSFKDFELILVDDGSNDASGDICDKYLKIDNRIKVIHKENGGVSSARNIGIENANGKYIAFVDPDDTINQKMYEIMMNKIIEDDTDIIVCQIKTINNKLKTESKSNVWKKVNCKINKKDIERNLIPDILTKAQYSMMPSFNKIYKMDLIKRTNIKFNEHMNHGEDARFNLLLIQEANSIEFVDEPLYNYYIRDRISLTRTFNRYFYDQILDNKKFGQYLFKKFNISNNKRYKEEYMNNTINFIHDLIFSNIDSIEKKQLTLNIINDKEFIEDLHEYNSPTLYYKLLKIALKSKYYLFIKGIIIGKQKISKVYRRIT